MLEKFKDIFACKIVLAANHQNPGNFQRPFCLQNCLCRKSSISWDYSKTFSPAKLSYPQIINILELLEDFFACKLSSTQTINILELFKEFFGCKIVLAANHQYPGNIQRFFACKIVWAAKHQYPGNIQRLFRLQNCLSRKSSKSWKYSKTFLPAKLS